MSNQLVRTFGLSKRYGDSLSVSNLDMTVSEGKIYGFLGPNGAGKSTTLKMLLGLVRPSGGEIDVFGKRFNSKNRMKILKNIGSLIETPSYYGHLTGKENLEIIQTILKVPKSNIDKVLKIVRLESQAEKKVRAYSLGMKQRLGIASAMLAFPKLLILDEPTNGLDPSGIHEIRNLVKSLPDLYDCTILISSHMLSEIELIADDIGILNHGRLLFEGSLDELRQSALRAGFAADNLEDMFLSMVEKDNAARKQRAQL